VTIIPDTKDWTWVLHRPCPECGFDTRSFPRQEVSALLLSNAAAWREVLAGPGDVHRRARADAWSPLEYACHVRDVCRIYAERLHLMLTQDAPGFPNWDQDATAVEDRYGEQDPAMVSAQLSAAAERLAADFAAVPDEGWQRTGTRSDGAAFTVESFARYFIHDPIHHLYDVTGRRAA
jgi:DinB superfamily